MNDLSLILDMLQPSNASCERTLCVMRVVRTPP